MIFHKKLLIPNDSRHINCVHCVHTHTGRERDIIFILFSHLDQRKKNKMIPLKELQIKKLMAAFHHYSEILFCFVLFLVLKIHIMLSFSEKEAIISSCITCVYLFVFYPLCICVCKCMCMHLAYANKQTKISYIR